MFSDILELFYTPPILLPNFWGVPFGVDPWCWDLQRANTLC